MPEGVSTERLRRRGLGLNRSALVPALICALILFTACSSKRATTPAASEHPPSVIAIAVRQEPIEEQARFVGQVKAADRVELRARVSGFLKERRFVEGQEVKPGDVVFLIEPDRYQAVVNERTADLAKAVANEENAAAQLKRGQELLGEKNMAPSKVDERKAAARIANVSIKQAEAALTAAKLNLSYARITAPVAGRIGLSKYSVGSLVGPESGVLATIVRRDPMYVQFAVAQRERLQVRRDIEAAGKDLKSAVVLARLADNSIYEHKGHLDAVDVTTNPGTDSFTVRAVFPNPDGFLVDQQPVGVLVEDARPTMEITVPQSALKIDQRGTFVLIVTQSGQTAMRYVALGPVVGAKIAVKSGLEASDLVIVAGAEKVRVGETVRVAAPEPAEDRSPP
jgi:membrane fusion protein (multidrug efflux system)